MKNTSRLRGLFALALVAAGVVFGGVALYRFIGPAAPVSEPAIVTDQQKTKPQGEAAAEAGDVLTGGTQQPNAQPSKPAPVVDTDSNKHDPFYYGSTPSVALDANPNVKSVVEAITQKNHPERLSILATRKPFDAKAYAADPVAYTSVVAPGRVFDTAQPGVGIPRLRTASPIYREIAQGDTTVLKVQAPPKSPVTFTSLDLGQFENQLSSITVQADAKGFATATFLASPGVVENIHILAGSPVASGQARFTIYVQWPQGTATAVSGNNNAGQVVSAQAK